MITYIFILCREYIKTCLTYLCILLDSSFCFLIQRYTLPQLESCKLIGNNKDFSSHHSGYIIFNPVLLRCFFPFICLKAGFAIYRNIYENMAKSNYLIYSASISNFFVDSCGTLYLVRNNDLLETV